MYGSGSPRRVNPGTLINWSSPKKVVAEKVW